MSTNLDHRASDPSEMKNAASGADLTLNSVARRRLLLKNIGKGTAVLAATVPVQTLAQGSVLLTSKDLVGNRHRCSVSGMQSGIHSQDPVSSSICGGYSPGWWGQKKSDGTPKNWPSVVNYNAAYNGSQLFTRDNLSPINGHPPSLWEVMSLPDYRNNQVWHWIGAWLNGFSKPFNFPYDNVQILAFYNSNDSAERNAAYRLIVDFLEKENPV